MSWFRNDKKGKPPHTWYPEILHWREGDQIICMEYGYGKATFKFKFKSVDETGNIYLTDEDGLLVQFKFYKFIKTSKNQSLESRKVQQNQNDSTEYMELMKTFQQAFDELQESDNHPKRLDEPQKETE